LLRSSHLGTSISSRHRRTILDLSPDCTYRNGCKLLRRLPAASTRPATAPPYPASGCPRHLAAPAPAA